MGFLDAFDESAFVEKTSSLTILHLDSMTQKQKEIYNQLTSDPKFEETLTWMHTKTLSELIGVPAGQRVSGRVIDSLMTKYPKHADVHYYIDITDTNNTRYVPRELFSKASQDKTRKFTLFNISSEYRTHMALYSKTFFDPFGRGLNVIHQTPSGEMTEFSMCKLRFYMWARRYHVFDFLKERYEDIARIQKDDQLRQRRNRQRKRTSSQMSEKEPHVRMKYRHVVGTLCPPYDLNPLGVSSNRKLVRCLPPKQQKSFL
jgi:hypothetical protein